MEYIVTIPDFGKKKEPQDTELLYKISDEFYNKKTINSFKQIFSKRPEYAWLIDKEQNIFSKTELKEKKLGNITKGVYFTKTNNGWVPISHYKYILLNKNVAYLDFMTSFLIKKGITTQLMPKMISKMKNKGIKKIKLIPYSKSNHEIFTKKFGFKKEGEFLVKNI